MRPAAGAILVRAAAILVCAAAVRYGSRALVSDVKTAFTFAPRTVFSPPFQAQMRTVTSTLPPGASVLYLSPYAEFWYSRMWQRALYPRNTIFLPEPAELDCTSLSRYRQAGDVRFAISVGDRFPVRGYRWSVPLGTLPGSTEESWWGELEP